MKKFLFSIFAVTALLICATAASAASLSPALDIIANESEMVISGLYDETVAFSTSQFTDASGKETYDSICITALPDERDGVLYYNDGAVCQGQIIPYEKTDKLCFEPADGSEGASFDFTFDGSYTMTCAIKLEKSQNRTPTVGKTPKLYTVASTVCVGSMRASDPDGDSLTYEVVEYPKTGKLVYDKSTGAFSYTSGSGAATDKFIYRVKDSLGATSARSEVIINVSAPATRLTFADMTESNYSAAVMTMADKGIMTYSEKDDKLYFEPTSEITRLEFLISTMNTFGADKLPCVNTSGFDDDSSIPDEYKAYVYSAKKLGIINGIEVDKKQYFMPDKSITLAEASVILNNIIGYTAEEGVSCRDAVPTWAKESVDAVYELGISEMTDGKIGANDTLTREEAADMLYKLTNLMFE